MIFFTLLLLIAGTTAAETPKAKDPGRLAPAAQPSPTALTAEMKTWARRIAPPTAPTDLRLYLLLNALLVAEEHSLEEISGYTPTVAEAFERRQANCVAFAHLFVALSREVGLATYFVMENEPEGIEDHGDLRVVVRHLAVGHGPPHNMQVLDFAGTGPAPPRRRVEVLSDRAALAIYYSNRGAELLLDGKLDAAIAWLEHAVELDTTLRPTRDNLEVALYRRAATRRHRPAEQPYLTAAQAPSP